MENLPDELTHIKPFLIRSEEMKTADPVISYYLMRYAVSLAIDYRKQNPGSQAVTDYLSSTLNLMEVKKNEIGNVQNPKEHYEKFITMLFVSADTEDRKSGSTKKTAQKFLILSYFIEAFNVMEDITPDWEDKRVFCKWKAADILKALKRGEKPLPGGPNERENFEEKKQPTNSGIGGGYQFSPPQDYNFTSANTANPPNLSQNSPFVPQNPPFVPQNLPQNFPYTPAPNEFQNSPIIPQNPPSFTQYPPPTQSVPTKTPEFQQPPPVRQPPPKPEVHQPGNSRTSNRPPKAVLTAEQRKVIDQAKKFGQNAVQELEYKNIQQAIIAFQNALKTLENFNS